MPEVQNFFDQNLYGAAVDAAILPAMARTGTRFQRLQNAPPCTGRRPMDVPTDDPTTQRAKIAATRAREDLVGLAIDREALRRTPLDRAAHVVRPGFRERGAAQEQQLARQRAEDEKLYLAYRHERAEATRRRLRATRDYHARETARQPVVQQGTQRAEQMHTRHLAVAYQALSHEDRDDVASELGAFERARAASRGGRRRPRGNRARVTLSPPKMRTGLSREGDRANKEGVAEGDTSRPTLE